MRASRCEHDGRLSSALELTPPLGLHPSHPPVPSARFRPNRTSLPVPYPLSFFRYRSSTTVRNVDGTTSGTCLIAWHCVRCVSGFPQFQANLPFCMNCGYISIFAHTFCISYRCRRTLRTPYSFSKIPTIPSVLKEGGQTADFCRAAVRLEHLGVSLMWITPHAAKPASP